MRIATTILASLLMTIKTWASAPLEEVSLKVYPRQTVNLTISGQGSFVVKKKDGSFDLTKNGSFFPYFGGLRSEEGAYLQAWPAGPEGTSYVPDRGSLFSLETVIYKSGIGFGSLANYSIDSSGFVKAWSDDGTNILLYQIPLGIYLPAPTPSLRPIKMISPGAEGMGSIIARAEGKQPKFYF